jgi:hypothetical protein
MGYRAFGKPLAMVPSKPVARMQFASFARGIQKEGTMPRKKSGVPRQKPPKQLTIATHLPTDDDALFTQCSAGWAAVKAKPGLFTAPSPQMDNALTALGIALQAAQGGSDAQKETAFNAARTVRNLWGQLAKYVESVLRAGPITAAPEVLASVLMYVSRQGAQKPKPPLAVKQMVSGTVKLVALAILNALTYDWEWSVDQANWSSTTTGMAKATLTGLTPGKTYYFRVRAFLRGATQTAYVGPVSLMVI